MTRNRPSYQELEKRIQELEDQALRRGVIEAELLEKHSMLRTQNIALIKKSIELSDVKRELEDKNYELELSRSELETALTALRESAERFRDLAELLPQPVFEIDVQGNITYANRCSFETFGYTPEDLEKGLNALEMFIPEERQRVNQNVQKRLTGEPFEGHEYTGLRKDGSTFPLLIYTDAIIRDNRPVGVRGIVLDITERRRTEEALREAHDELEQRVLERTAALTEANEQLKQEIEERKRAEHALRQSMEQTDIAYKQATVYAHQLNEEIARRDRAEEELRESEELLRATLDSTADGILAVNEAGQVTHANPLFAEMWRIPKELIEEGDDTKLLNYVLDQLEEPDAFLSKVKELYGTSKEDFDTLLFKDGRVFERSSSPLIKDGQTAGRVWSFRDVTEQKKAEEERKKLEAQLQQAQKMEAIGTLAGGIAHDFNNLLMAIQGRLSLMLIDVDYDHPHFVHLSAAEDAVRKGADLTKQLLGFARGGKYEVKPTDLNQVIERSSEMFGRTKKEIRIQRRYQENIWPVEVDRGQIEQVLLNLYVNAWQAMPTGGDLYLETQNVVLDDRYTKLFDMKPGSYVKISVTDTGVGMDKGTRERVFEPFFSAKETGTGTGLGLASAYGIIKNHGGMINVYSEKGHGATFDIYLPATHKELVKEEEPPAEVLGGAETLLLVDDEDTILEVGEEMLTALGYKVMVAVGGKMAVELYKKNQDKIDMVILDMIMPDMGGAEVYDKLKEINPDVKVLLSSGYSIEGRANEILERGCNGFIQKPFSMRQLSSKLRQILEKQ